MTDIYQGFIVRDGQLVPIGGKTGGGDANIDDGVISSDTTWSSRRIQEAIDEGIASIEPVDFTPIKQGIDTLRSIIG